MPTARTDYAAAYFPYNTPTPINGEPSYKALKKLKNELRANASSVDSDLGGGDHGYLGLVLDETEYARIVPDHPFIAPDFPGVLRIPPGTETVDALNYRENHRQNISLYRECREVERALMRHITTAVEPKYIDSLKNEDTDLVEEDISTVLDFLFTHYGKVPTREVKEKEHEVLATPFIPSDPMVTIYRPIEQLRILAEIAKIPYTEFQVVDFGLQLVKNTRDFENALGEWNQKPTQERTWDNFKTHFQNAQQTLKDIRGPTMKQAGYHHANHLAAELKEELRENQAQMLALVQNVNMDDWRNEEEIQDTKLESANAMSQNIQQETIKMIKALQTELKNLKDELKSKKEPYQARQYKKTPDNATFNRPDTSKFCWTHGGCGHTSNECTRKAPGHQMDATKDNKKGGSLAFTS